jgi:hypothetical protein
MLEMPGRTYPEKQCHIVEVPNTQLFSDHAL